MKHPESQRIKLLRGKETLREFAERFDVSGSNIQVIEADKQGLAITLAKKISSHYNVTLDWLYGNTETGGPSDSHMDRISHQMAGIFSKLASPNNNVPKTEPTISTNSEEYYKQLLEGRDKYIGLQEKQISILENLIDEQKKLIEIYQGIIEKKESKE